MAITVNAVTKPIADTTDGTSFSASGQSVSGNYIVAVVEWFYGNPSSVAATYGGVSMSQVALALDTSNVTRPGVAMFVLASPASGSQTLAITFGDEVRSCSAALYDLSGVDGVGATDTNTSNSQGSDVTIDTTEDGSFAIHAGSQRYFEGGYTADTSFTERFDGSTGTGGFADNTYYNADRSVPTSGTTLAPDVTFPNGGNPTAQAMIELTPAAGGGGTTVTATEGSITYGGNIATITQSANQTVEPVAGAITLAGYVPTVTQSAALSVSPSSGSVLLTGYAPTVSQSSATVVSPASGSVLYAGYVPTVTRTANQVVTPSPGSAEWRGFRPLINPVAAGPSNASGLGLRLSLSL